MIAIRDSRPLRRDYRRAKRFPRRDRFVWVWRIALSAGLGALVFGCLTKTRHPATGLAVIALWMTAWVFVRACGLWTTLYRHDDILVLELLPVHESVIFNWQLQHFLRTVSFSLFDLFAGFGALALFLDFSPLRWMAVPISALIAGATFLSLVALCTVYLSRSVNQFLSFCFAAFGFFMLLLNRVLYWPFLRVLDRNAPEVLAVMPIGWPISLFQLGLPDSDQSWMMLVVPTAITISSLHYSVKRLRSTFRLSEGILPEVADMIPTTDTDDAMTAESAVPRRSRLDPTEIERLIQSRRFLDPPPWRHLGWSEQLLWRWLNSRERSLSEFAFPNGCIITAVWRRIFRNSVVVLAAAFVAGLVNPTLKTWIFGGGLLVLGFQALGQLLGSGVAFRQVSLYGITIPLHANFGIGYQELSRLLLKYTAVQVPLFIPFAIAWSVPVFPPADLPWHMGITFGFRAGTVFFAVRLLLVSLGFSGGSNDSTRLRWSTLGLIAIVVVLGTLFLGLGIAGLLLPELPIALVFCLGALLDAYLLFRIYGWFYNVGTFDLMSRRNSL